MILSLHNRKIETSFSAFIMGIVNCTPDSFFAESRGGVERARSLIEQGADLLDLGAESTRPGSEYVSAEEEISRLIPVIKEIRKFSDIPISVDTRKGEVFKAAFDVGADILNDISSFEDSPELASFAAEKKIPVILMHKRGIPSDMQKNTEYSNVFDEVNGYLESRVKFALDAGIEKEKIIVDPGIGFGKNMEQNYELVSRCGELCGGKYMVLMALSRKRFLRDSCGLSTAEECLIPTVAANLLSVERGASMVRVHDVAPCKESLAVLKYTSSYESV